MVINWLLHIAYDSPQLPQSDPERVTFEKDKERIDEFFIAHDYRILRIDITKQKSHQIPGKEIYLLGKDFFHHLNLFDPQPSQSPDAVVTPSYMIEIFDRVVLGLHCLKDIAQQIGTDFYIKFHAVRLKALLEIMGFNVIAKSVVNEGGLFLKGLPPTGAPFLIISHGFLDPFREFKLDLLQSPPDLGVNSKDTHIDTYLGIINFREELMINGVKYNGILYVHTETLKKIHADSKKQQVWNILKEEMRNRRYLIREYEPETEYQNIGINFKFDHANHTLLTNAFPKKERSFLKKLGISVIAPEYSFGANDSMAGGINCSYLLIPHNSNIQKNIINWIATNIQ